MKYHMLTHTFIFLQKPIFFTFLPSLFFKKTLPQMIFSTASPSNMGLEFCVTSSQPPRLLNVLDLWEDCLYSRKISPGYSSMGPPTDSRQFFLHYVVPQIYYVEGASCSLEVNLSSLFCPGLVCIR